MWKELVFLYVHYDEFDNAALTMMKQASDSWEHAQFKDVIVKVSNLEIYYKALRFYLDEHPMLLNDLLTAMMPRVDHTRVVQMFQKSDNLPLIKPYLVAAQSVNNQAVNIAYNDLLIEEEDFKTLRDSIDHFDNFDNIALAQRLEKHELLEFRRIAAHLYKKNRRWKQSVALSKQDKLYRDAMETVAESKDRQVTEELIKFFVENDLKECFAASLYTCYDLLKPDFVMELAWRNRLMDCAMPYMIQTMRELVGKVDLLEKANAEREEKEALQEKKDLAAVGPAIVGGQIPGQPLMIANAPAWGSSGYAMQPGYNNLPPSGSYASFGGGPAGF